MQILKEHESYFTEHYYKLLIRNNIKTQIQNVPQNYTQSNFKLFLEFVALKYYSTLSSTT